MSARVSRQIGSCGLALAALLCMMKIANSADLVIDGVPIPDDVTIAPAPAGAPELLSRFPGAWVGAWDDTLKHILIVEQVRADGTARIVYGVGDEPAFGVARTYRRFDATVSGGSLAVAAGAFSARYELAPDNTLTGVFQRGAIRSNARLSKIDRADLRPDAVIAWSRRNVAFLDTALTEEGKPVRLEVVTFKPDGAGPFPLLVINHGSTGRGNDPALFRQTRWSFAIADLFTCK
jgi:hypothetical protein